MTLREHSSKFQISLDVGTLESLSWFVTFMKLFNGVVRFNKFTVPFDTTCHLLRSDIKFEFTGVHVRVKWAKNVQAPEKQHWVNLPAMRDSLMCPVKMLAALCVSHC